MRSDEIRIGLFLPQYAKDSQSGKITGVGTGLLLAEIALALAAARGAELRIVEYPSPTSAVAGLNGDSCDIAFLGIEPSRAAKVDFTPALFEFDYTYLVPAGSAMHGCADADRPGTRIAIVDGHASALALRRLVTKATLIGSDLPDAAFALLRSGMADAFALPREQLASYSDALPGSRVLDDGYGINRVAIAVAKGRAGWLADVSDFAARAKESGIIADAIARIGLHGFSVAAP
ncbi:MAG: transporter substrate-binding domain-containing protein [Xanthobacteraceae bacterium]